MRSVNSIRMFLLVYFLCSEMSTLLRSNAMLKCHKLFHESMGGIVRSIRNREGKYICKYLFIILRMNLCLLHNNRGPKQETFHWVAFPENGGIAGTKCWSMLLVDYKLSMNQKMGLFINLRSYWAYMAGLRSSVTNK